MSQYDWLAINGVLVTIALGEWTYVIHPEEYWSVHRLRKPLWVGMERPVLQQNLTIFSLSGGWRYA